ncbi:MAG TPA: FKBP-type peptidyl-prolyl cis-trans isomerase [bacterium]|nr:FKBP-type peptidyl-prolyl cis-trans isomerase [bacterium]
MKKFVLAALTAVLAFGAVACHRFGGANRKEGYAVGLSMGKGMATIQDKLDFDQIEAGIKDQIAGKPAMQPEEVQQNLGSLRGGAPADKAKVGYAVGLTIGNQVKSVATLINIGSLMEGIKDQVAGKPGMDDAAMRDAFTDLEQRRQAAMAPVAEKNKADGQAFLDKNKLQAGVKVTASGLQYNVLKQGGGAEPKATSVVKVLYTGMLIDGTVFDSTTQHDQKGIQFPLNQVIPGWTEGLQLMKVGSKYHFVIPSELAYGASGKGEQIGPNSVLQFDVELLAVVKK